MFVQLAALLLVLIPILAVVLDSPLGKALAARMEGRSLRAGEEPAPDRMLQLEGEVERLSAEVQRLSEESDFLHKLLAERPPPKRLPTGDDEDAS
ncbi:MAG: hypothetical protein KC645_16035 [Gemmatimonadetes bacterium]|nr:hypothetical protein [Gemmatimonadota bacterium]